MLGQGGKALLRKTDAAPSGERPKSQIGSMVLGGIYYQFRNSVESYLFDQRFDSCRGADARLTKLTRNL